MVFSGPRECFLRARYYLEMLRSDARWIALKHKVRKVYGETLVYRGIWLIIILTVLPWNATLISRDRPDRNYEMARLKPFIFVGGHQSSGTTLMRILLDVHPMIRCGPEPVVGEWLLQFRMHMNKHKDRLTDIGIYPNLLDSATGNYLAEIIDRMGAPAPYLCHKDPRTFYYLAYMGYLFPNAKFINMLRDGRATILSSMKRNLTKATEWAVLRSWEVTVRQFQYDCQTMSNGRCLTVYYEQLVLYPERTMRMVLNFLGVPWDPRVLEHEKWVQEVSNISAFDKSTTQIMEKIYTKSLSSWSDEDSGLSKKFIETAMDRCPLIHELGYDAVGFPPDYRFLAWDQPNVSWTPNNSVNASIPKAVGTSALKLALL